MYKAREERFNTVTPLPIACHVTLFTHRNRSLFTATPTCNRLAYLIFETAALHRYSLFAFCIMPDHIHILCQPGNLLVSHFVNLLTFRSNYELVKRGLVGTVWHDYYREQRLGDEEVVATALRIFENPVRAGLVDDAAAYPYSYVYEAKGYVP